MHNAPKIEDNGLLALDIAERDYYIFGTKRYLRNFDRAECLDAGPF
jgi:hypothetical protein